MKEETMKHKKIYIIETVKSINNDQVINFLFKYIKKIKERC